MEVILTTDVEKLGLRGEVVNVARGYMRNYLQPRGLAEIATPARVAEVRRREDERARHEARTIEQAHEIATTLTKTVLRFEVHAGSTGTLFGSVTPTEIADEIWRTRKIRVDRRKIELAEPIKRIGRYAVPIDVFQDVRVEVKTLVVPEGGELSDDELPDMTAAPVEETAASSPAEADGAVASPGDEAAARGRERGCPRGGVRRRGRDVSRSGAGRRRGRCRTGGRESAGRRRERLSRAEEGPAGGPEDTRRGYPARRLSNFAYRRRNASRTVSVGPFRCLATISSAIPWSSESSPL